MTSRATILPWRARPLSRRLLLPAALALLLPGLLAAADGAPAIPDFNAEVRPILAGFCFKCHGPDDKGRKAKLRLDVREVATRPAKSGDIAIVPGDVAASHLIARITSSDQDEVMPPPATQKTLSALQKDILTRWIAGGAVYRPHWAFVPPRQAEPPTVAHAQWARTPIDHFVAARLEAEGLEPSPAADRYTLIRRVSLDLIGLPPTAAEADAFVADTAPDAYERVVDHLLAQPQYGERWARRWLDLARYADTNGYEKDRPRSIWPYRDWVINALNADMPFDRFTIEQLAGDLLPHPDQDALTATGFHRNTMLNEEGGIDPLEFRFYSLVDRVSTTGKAWLGLTVQCAQCHTHKYDPITQREYYQLMAFLDNADEPTYLLKPQDYDRRRSEVEAKIAAVVAALPERFETDIPIAWSSPAAATLTTSSGEKGQQLSDASLMLTGPGAARDDYQVEFDVPAPDISMLRLEAIPDKANPKGGPGRAASGNFVINELQVLVAPTGGADKPVPVKLVKAEADYSQKGFDVKGAIDGDPKTGWAVDSDKIGSPRTATFTFDKPVQLPAGAHFIIRLEQQYGDQHTLGHFRLSLGHRHQVDDLKAERTAQIERGFSAWLERERARSVRWTVLHPASASAAVPILSVLDDDSVLASGDQTKSDTYELAYQQLPERITALRLEVLPDESLPNGGPGRVYYEGAPGDFGLSELTASADGAALHFAKAMESFANGGNHAANAIDGRTDTIWSIDGGQGRAHNAVFVLAEPLSGAKALKVSMLFERYFSAGLGRFRFSVTGDPPPPGASEVPAGVAELLARPAAARTAADQQRLRSAYLLTAPETRAAQAEIDGLRKSLRAYPTTLVFAERPSAHHRSTFMHNRGEYLQPTERVEADVLSVLPPLPAGAAHDRLALARWLVDRGNPLTARVTVNRQWAALFGRGIVRTVDDFGYQGDPPTNPALLDWLAVAFMDQGWSLKKLQRLIVLSATYQQSSRATPALLARDPGNLLLARGPRFRLEAELIRDGMLKESGLLSGRIGGPSVYPPQPANVTTDGAYGSLEWKVSSGEDRYRRGLYTFSKRTAPYAMFTTFDGPSGEACIAQREISNSPLQALTMLNDTVILEAAQALGAAIAAQPGGDGERATALFRRCLTRPPEAQELGLLVAFVSAQRARFASHELDPAALGGAGPGDAAERAAWVALARVLLNLDEAITKG
jgi:hypothetical protein